MPTKGSVVVTGGKKGNGAIKRNKKIVAISAAGALPLKPGVVDKRHDGRPFKPLGGLTSGNYDGGCMRRSKTPWSPRSLLV